MERTATEGYSVSYDGHFRDSLQPDVGRLRLLLGGECPVVRRTIFLPVVGHSFCPGWPVHDCRSLFGGCQAARPYLLWRDQRTGNYPDHLVQPTGEIA